MYCNPSSEISVGHLVNNSMDGIQPVHSNLNKEFVALSNEFVEIEGPWRSYFYRHFWAPRVHYYFEASKAHISELLLDLHSSGRPRVLSFYKNKKSIFAEQYF